MRNVLITRILTAASAFLMISGAQVGIMAAEDASTGGLQTRNQRYHLQPNDVLEIKYRYTPEYNQEVTVEPDNFVNLNLVGDLKAGGLTLEQFRAEVLTRVSVRLRDPEVNVVLKSFEKQFIMVGGEVAKPGKFEYHDSLTAIQAVTLAGGFTRDSKHSQILMLRKVDDQTAETRLLDLKSLLASHKLEEDISLKPGDFIYVPQNKISKIERFVKWGSAGVFVNPPL